MTHVSHSYLAECEECAATLLDFAPHTMDRSVRFRMEQAARLLRQGGPNDEVKRYRTALERIVEGVPAHDNHNGLFFAHFDENGNEIGIEQVDPMAVIGSILSVATEALKGVEK